jgi:hypothetical protein
MSVHQFPPKRWRTAYDSLCREGKKRAQEAQLLAKRTDKITGRRQTHD